MAFHPRLEAALTWIGGQIKVMRPRLIPSGGATGQVLAKSGPSDFDAGWVNVASGSATPGWAVAATGAGASQNITLPEAIAAASIFVFVNGLRQEPTTHYSTSGTTLTITAPSGALIRVEKPAGNPGADGEDGEDAVGIADAPSDGKTYGRKDGAWAEASAGGGTVNQQYPEPPWTKRVCSRWKSGGGSSAQITATSMRAQPFNTMGRKISAVEFHVQGSISAGQLLHIGIYNSDPVTGMPTSLLWANASAYDLTAGGAGTKSISTGVLTPANDRVWVMYYLTAGSTQFAIGGASGIAEREFGLSPGGGVNANVQALLGSGSWPGSMPATFPYASDGSGLSTAGNYINFFLSLPVT